MIKAYYADICDFPVPSDDDIGKNVYSVARAEYLFSLRAPKRLKQSYYMWLLLQNICKEAGVDCSDFERGQNGNWFSPSLGYNFSFSHSENIVLVAVSEAALGVDVELISDRILKLKNKITGSASVYSAEELTAIWTEKESEYKRGSSARFITDKIIDCQKNEYCVCVCSDENRVEFIQKTL